MSIEFDAAVIVGIQVTEEMIPKEYRKVIPPMTHNEPRYDPKTGNRIGDEIVTVKEKQIIFMLDGEEIDPNESKSQDPFDAFLSALAYKIDKRLRAFCSDDFPFNAIYLPEPLKTYMTVDQLLRDAHILKKAHKALHKMGIKVKPASIMPSIMQS